MNSMLVAANAVLPIAFMMFLGAFLKSRKIVRDTSFKDFNWVVFHVCLPLTLFNSIQGMDPAMLTDPAIVIFAIGALAAVILLAMLLIGRMKLDDRQKGVMVQAIYRSNFVILGIPIIESIYGAGNTGPTPLLVAFVVPVFNVVSVLILSHYSGAKGNIGQTVKKVFTNPLIIGAILGFVYKFSGITMPEMISGIISQITKMSTPLSLLVLGGSFEFVSIKNNLKLLAIVTAARLIIVPVAVLGAAIALGYRGVDLASLMALFAGPAAIASFSMAQEMGLDGELAAQCVMSTTVCVILTMFLLISGLGTMGLL
ncbi:MAG: AEC family transporter [Solobacterium sp.]|nr:AEC family transporter [Solobacterium sp.]